VSKKARRIRGSSAALAVLLAAAAIVVAACGGSSGNSGSASSSGGKVTLAVWDYFGYAPEPKQAMDDVYKAFEAKNPNITIKRTTLAYPDMRTKLIQSIASGKMPDAAIIDASDLPVFAGQNALADLTSRVSSYPDKGQYFPNILTSYKGKNWMMPFRANTIALFYNKDLFKADGIAGPPTTWEELRATAKKLTHGNQFGYCFAGIATGEGDYQMLPFIWQAGGDLTTLGDAASVKALTFINQLVNVDKVSPKGVVGWDQQAVGERFNSKNCAMMQNGPWQIPPTDAAKINYGVVPLPGDVEKASTLGGENIVASNKAPLDEVWKLMTFLQESSTLTPTAIKALGLLPQRKDQLTETKYDYTDAAKPFAAAVQLARSRAYGSKYGEIQPLLWRMEQQVLTGGKTPEQAVKEAAAGVKPLLEAG
jgi:multiple sugar transport system substrate-binding protein